MPNWVHTGFTDYLKHFPKELPLELMEIAVGKRDKNADIAARFLEKESELMLAVVAKGSYRHIGYSRRMLGDAAAGAAT